jgi:hypothetical protein
VRAVRHHGCIRRSASVLLLAAVPAACTHVVERPPAAGVVAQLSLDRFMQAVNQRDIVTMEQTFGTEDGPIGDTGSTFGCFFKKIGSWFGGTACRSQRDVQVQMAALADILKHDDYKVVRELPVAGRLSSATQIFVDITQGDRTISGVPFLMARTSKGDWMVERVDLQRVMGSG